MCLVTPPTTLVSHTGHGMLAAIRQHHLCRAAIKECGVSPAGLCPPPAPVPMQLWGDPEACLCHLEAV